MGQKRFSERPVTSMVCRSSTSSSSSRSQHDSSLARSTVSSCDRNSLRTCKRSSEAYFETTITISLHYSRQSSFHATSTVRLRSEHKSRARYSWQFRHIESWASKKYLVFRTSMWRPPLWDSDYSRHRQWLDGPKDAV